MKKLLSLFPILVLLVWCSDNVEINKYEWLSDVDTCIVLAQELLHNENAEITGIVIDDTGNFDWKYWPNFKSNVRRIKFKAQKWNEYIDWYCLRANTWDLWASKNNIYSVHVWDISDSYID